MSETLCIFCSRLIAGTRSSLDNDQQLLSTSISLLQHIQLQTPLITSPHYSPTDIAHHN